MIKIRPSLFILGIISVILLFDINNAVIGYTPSPIQTYKWANAPDSYYRLDYQWYLHNTGEPSQLFTSDGTLVGGDAGGNYDIGFINVITNNNIKIGIIDTGIDVNHPEFAGITFSGWNFIEDNSDLSDFSSDSHGTSIAGVIAAKGIRIQGILQITNLIICKVSFIDRDYADESINTAIKYCADNGCKVVNLSWTTPYDKFGLSNACIYAASKGMIIVCAVQNVDMDTDVSPDYPESWQMDNVVAVTSITRAGIKYSPAAWGKTTIHLAAPGRVICTLGSPSTYVYASGTSLAAPMVTATLAAIASKYPNQPYQYWIEKLVKSCSPDLSVENTISGGRLNMTEALKDDVSMLKLTTPGQLTIQGSAMAKYMLQSSTDLIHWKDLVIITEGEPYYMPMTNNYEFFRTILK